MTPQLPVRLPRILLPQDREALGLLGFRIRSQGESFMFAELPSGWSDKWDERQKCFIYTDARERGRVQVFPKAPFTMEEANSDEDPIQIELPGIRILRRFHIPKLGDPHFRVYDRVHGINLTDSFDARDQAMAYLDEHYPGWNNNVLAHWDDVDLTA